MQNKIISATEAVQMIKAGDRVMIGGFAGCANPMLLINALKAAGTGELTLIGNDTGDDYLYDKDSHVGILVRNHQVKKVIASHIGRNPDTCQQFQAGELEVEFVPQGTLAERIRAAGFGLGGILTKTGLGTEIAKDKAIIEIDNEAYLLEKPLSADFALVKVAKADTLGNVVLHGSSGAFAKVMMAAAATTIVEAEEIVEAGELDPDQITMPCIFVNYIVKGGK